jgi:hypothetical protein
VAPVDFRNPHWLLDPLRHKIAAVGEKEALAGAEAAHGVGDQNLAALRLGRDPRSQDDSCPEEVAVFFDRLAGVQADTDGEGLALV